MFYHTLHRDTLEQVLAASLQMYRGVVGDSRVYGSFCHNLYIYMAFHLCVSSCALINGHFVRRLHCNQGMCKVVPQNVLSDELLIMLVLESPSYTLCM